MHALTTPLVTDTEGRKFGKSTGGGNIWLDPTMTSPYAWYQYFLNVADADAASYLRMFTFLTPEEIEGLEKDVAERPHLRAAQRRLAAELTTLVHGQRQTDQVVAASGALFGRGDLRDLDAGTLDAALAEAPSTEVRWSSARRSSICSSPPGSRRAAAPPAERSEKAGRTSTTSRSSDATGCLRQATSWQEVGWSRAAASATWLA